MGGCCQSRPRPDFYYQHQFKEGLKHKQQTNYVEAIKMFRKVIEINNDYQQAYLQIAKCEYLRKDWGRAIDAYNEVLKKNPKYALAHYNIGVIWIETQNYTSAIQSLNKYVKNGQYFSKAHCQLGICRMKVGQYSTAIQQFKLCKNDQQANKVMGICYDSISMFKQALLCFSNSLKQNKNNVQIRNLVAKTLFNSAKYKESTDQCKSIIQKYPQNAEAYKNLARVQVWNGDYHQAITHLEKALNLSKGNKKYQIQNLIGFAHKRSKHENKYVQYFRYVTQYIQSLNHVNDHQFNELGFAYSNLGNHPKAIQHYSNGLKINDKNLMLHLNIVQSLIAKQQHQSALKHIKAAKQLSQNNDRVFYIQGSYFKSMKDVNKAEACFTKALKINKSCFLANQSKIEMLVDDPRYSTHSLQLGKCIECCQTTKNSICIPCGHSHYCYGCGKDFKVCPQCKQQCTIYKMSL